MLTFANLGCKLYCAMVPSPHHGTGTMSPTGDGDTEQLKMGGGVSVMTCRPPQFYALDLAEITVCLCKTKSPVSLCLPIFASLETTTQCHGFLYRVPQKYRPKVNGFRNHPASCACLSPHWDILSSGIIDYIFKIVLYCIINNSLYVCI